MTIHELLALIQQGAFCGHESRPLLTCSVVVPFVCELVGQEGRALC